MGEILEMRISQENAEKEMEKYLAYFDLNIDELKSEQSNSDRRDALQSSYDRLIKAVRKGRLEVKTDGGEDGDEIQLIQTVGKIGKETKLIYKELSGAAKVAMKDAETNDDYGRVYALAGSLNGLGMAGMKKLKGRDLSTAESIGAIVMNI